MPVPGSTLGYLEESDRSRWAEARLAELLENVEVDLGQGACRGHHDMFNKRVLGQRVGHAEAGQRSLYYDIDVKCAWRAEWRGFDLSPDKDGPRPLEGSIRLYNVSHETRYEPGADPTVAYVYPGRLQTAAAGLVRRLRGDGRGAALGADVDRWGPRAVRGGGGRGGRARAGDDGGERCGA